MDKALTTPPADVPAHLLMAGSAALTSMTVFGLTPDEWVAIASIATVAGVGASILMYFFRVWMGLREDARRKREVDSNIAARESNRAT